MTPLDRERHVLDLIVPRLEESGYSVFVRPPRSLLPSFMAGYVPDAIAIGRPKNLAIEVVQTGAAETPGLADLTDTFAATPDWELRVVYYQPEHDAITFEPPARPAIEAMVARLDGLATAGEPEAALLLGWAALEATGRLLLPDRLRRPAAGGRLLELLAQEGVVTPEEAAVLRALLPVRNRIAHGDLRAKVGAADVGSLSAILRLALAEADPVPH